MKTVQEYLDHAKRSEELSAQTDAPPSVRVRQNWRLEEARISG